MCNWRAALFKTYVWPQSLQMFVSQDAVNIISEYAMNGVLLARRDGSLCMFDMIEGRWWEFQSSTRCGMIYNVFEYKNVLYRQEKNHFAFFSHCNWHECEFFTQQKNWSISECAIGFYQALIFKLPQANIQGNFAACKQVLMEPIEERMWVLSKSCADSVRSFEPELKLWKTHRRFPKSNNNVARFCVTFNGYLYVFSKRFCGYLQSNGQWIKTQKLSSFQVFACAVVFEDKIYFFGGQWENMSHISPETLFCYDPFEDCWTDFFATRKCPRQLKQLEMVSAILI